ncbi:enoyl-CoA hydratase family protein [Hoyosella rhizosphaerae]|uniref:Enoyl-CoA hydratase n=1 Tax=Hoyosella rhizosphaerae TaxID=1755582 RepID=A0A916UM74_9ACTN|nr:enoyl-CoA hydratase family protein [Hoyosella rhizosphaerae]MBN4927804.1 enoyl-CoA hydratase family protein [Hoyosella rhizosphaerae]GGC76965.1 enoyl-CoA hydratase [Hoyosella rhizosphaerae]
MSESEFVKYAVEAGVATITLDSPHNRNALSTKLVKGVHDSLNAAAEDDDARVIVLTHTGGTFCAGADLSEASEVDGQPLDPQKVAQLRTSQMRDLLKAIVAHPKPVIAQIDGHVRAGGMGLVGACDLAVAGPSCTFALTEAKLGLAPSIISLTLLPKLSARAAGRYFLTGEKFDAQEAQRIGLVTTADDDAAASVKALCSELVKASPQGLAASKSLTTAAVLAGFDERGEELAAMSARLFASEEAREGMIAFLQRRTPRWAEVAVRSTE